VTVVGLRENLKLAARSKSSVVLSRRWRVDAHLYIALDVSLETLEYDSETRPSPTGLHAGYDRRISFCREEDVHGSLLITRTLRTS